MKYLFYIGSLFFLQLIYSQEARTPFFYSENGIVTALDTNSLYKFHEYRIDNEYFWVGNNGQDSYSLVFNAENETKFQYSRLLSSIQNYSYKEYDVVVPFTTVKFVQGARLEQYFNLLHTQNFSKNGNFSLEYDKISSDGSYLRQKTNNNKLNATGWYKTPNKNYSISFFANRVKNTKNLNGGILKDSIFIIDSEFSTNRKTIDVNLDSASVKEITNQLSLHQSLKIVDNLDSLGLGIIQTVNFKSSFTNSKRYFTDGSINSEFYKNIFLDSTGTNDSIKLNEIKQEIAYNLNIRNLIFQLGLSPHISYYYTDFRQAYNHLWLNELSIGLRGNFEYSKFKLNSEVDYFTSGYRKGNYKFNNTLKLFLSKDLEWCFTTSFNKYNPSLDLNQYYGNHSIWDNNFAATEAISISTGTVKNKWDILAKFTYTDIKNPIYFNYLEEATQTLDFSQIIQGTIEKEFTLKKWRITPKAVYQHTGGVIVYRLPKYFTNLKIGYEFNAFRKKLAVFTGVKLTYYNKVQLMSYAPSLGQFYLANTNNNNNKVGNYPFLDFFINAKIKDVRLFFALTHVNEGLTKESNYFGAINYPLEDRAYKIGISWNFKK